MASDRTRGNDFKLKVGRSRLDVRKNIFIQRGVNHWQRLPRETDAPSLEMFKGRLDRGLNNLINYMTSLPMGGEIELRRCLRSFPTHTSIIL